MNNTGEQLHPNWRALATLHIPIKRFIKEGTHQTEQGTHRKHEEKYEIRNVKAKEIQEFYEELVQKPTKNNGNITSKEHLKLKTNKILEVKAEPTKVKFEVRNYFRCAMENKVECLKTMDFKGHDINSCDNYGWSSLMMAACEGAYDAVEFLLSLGVDRNIKDRTGKTAKDIAQKKGYIKIVTLLEMNGLEEPTSEDFGISEVSEDYPFYCEVCKRNFRETSESQHLTSTVHQFNIKSNLPTNKLQKFNIPPRNRGLQLMVKQGWDKESGLGPSQAGRLYPVKTVLRKQRTGLGIEQEAARVTHFEAFDLRAVQRNSSDYYRKKPRNRNDMRREKVREWKRDRRLRNELN